MNAAPDSLKCATSVLPRLMGLLLLTGCSSDSVPGDTHAVVRDSLGIRIVENVDPVWQEGDVWTIPQRPSLLIGQADGPEEYQFFQVRGARRLDDGRIAVANAGTQEIKIYNASGAHETTIGGQGQGPGEFAWIQALLSWSGDSLAAHDLDLCRLSVFSAEGRLGRTMLLSGDSGAGHCPNPQGLLADGSIVMEPNMGPVGRRAGNIIERIEQPLLRFDPVEERHDTIAVTFSVRWVSLRTERGPRAFPVPYGAMPQIAVDRVGVYHGYPSDYQVDYYRPGDGLQMIVRRVVEKVPVTERHIAQAWDSLTGFPYLRAGAARRHRADVTFSETLPAFGALMVDDDGNLWVRDFAPPGDPGRSWAVFDPKGSWLGTVLMPDGVRMWQIGRDFVLGSWKDDLNVEYVGIWALEKGIDSHS